MVRTSSSAAHTTITYEEFKGCDFSADKTDVSRYRSPDGLNMLSDNGGNPIKRNGFEHKVRVPTTSTAYSVDEAIAIKKLGDDRLLYIYGAQSTLYMEYRATLFNTADMSTAVYTSAFTRAADTKVTSVIAANGKVYFSIASFTQGTKTYVCTTEGIWQITSDEPIQIVAVSGATAPDDKFYTPTILVGKKPDGTDGVAYESINLLDARVCETFFGDGASVDFYASLEVDGSTATTTSDLKPTAVVDGDTYTFSGYNTTPDPGEFTIYNNPLTGTAMFRFGDIPGSATDVTNVTITYEALTGNTNRLTMPQTLAEGASQRWWFAEFNGSNKLYYSALGDFLYVPDNNYVAVGTDGVKIKGLLPVSSSLGVIKENNQNESTLWYVTNTTLTTSTTTVDTSGNATTTSETEYVYKVENGLSDVGGIAEGTFLVLADEPLYLSEQGVVGITSKSTTSEKVVRKRSMYLDGKLLNEDSLASAVACIWKGYYVLAVGGHLYLLDSRQKTTESRGNTSYNYEGYYWELGFSADIDLIAEVDDTLWFASGSCLYALGTGYADKRLVDGSTESTSVKCVWSTCDDDDNCPQYRKTAMKKGSYVVLPAYDQTSFNLHICKDYGLTELIQAEEDLVGRGAIDFSFEEVDFGDIAFSESLQGIVVHLASKIKKYKSLKLIFENDEAEPFGIYKIVKSVEYSQYTR